MSKERTKGNDDNRLVSPEEFRAITGIPREVLYRALKSGAIPHIKSGRNFLIPLQSGMASLDAEARRSGGTKSDGTIYEEGA